MRIKQLVLAFCLIFLCGTLVHAERVDMLKAGAKADGTKLNTELINKTIDRLSAKGGGTLFFPSGKYLTGAVKLKSNITIELEAGATLLFSDNFDDYLPFVDMRYEGVMMKSFSPLFYAVDQHDITIKGEGTIDGQGKRWWAEFFRVIVDLQKNGIKDLNKYQPMWDKANKDLDLYNVTNADYKEVLDRRFFRPSFIQPIRCKNIKIEGIKIINSPFWTVNPEFCENVTIKGITINNPLSPNTDGINPSSCKNVHISDCHISVGDDCITLKSGRDLQARQLGVPCENITITNCTMLAGHGGVVIGSEMSGDVRKVTISNCVFDGTDRGIRIKSTRGRGGIVEEIRVDNIVMKDIKKEAIVLSLFYSKMDQEPVSDRTPVFRNIHISNLTGTKVNSAVSILGIEEMPISDVTLNNINIQSESGIEANLVKNLELNNVRIDAKKGPAFKFSHVENLELNAIKSGTPNAEAPLLKISDSKDCLIQGCYPQAGSKSFLFLEGDNKNVILMHNYFNRLPSVVDKGSVYTKENLIIKE
jgi:polygalacturonase